MPKQRPLWKTLWYNFLHFNCRLAAIVLFRIRVSGREQLPPEGPLLVCSNHQSLFDPVLVGLVLDRRLNFLARDTLFSFAPFRWLIQSLDAIPIDREGVGLAGIKETLKRLKRGEGVLIFPEGTRTADGEISPLKPGFIALARRGKVTLLPMAIDGAYDAWPRRQMLPSIARIHVAIGEALSPEQIANLDDNELTSEVERRIRACFQIACHGRAEERAVASVAVGR